MSDDPLRTFEDYLEYQAVDRARTTADELAMWRGYYDQSLSDRANAPEIRLKDLRRAAGDKLFAVAIQNDAGLWLTMWAKYALKGQGGEVFMLYPRDPVSNPHGSYHLDGTFHQKFRGKAAQVQQRQQLTASFKGKEHLGHYFGHGVSIGAICYQDSFDDVITVRPGMLGAKDGAVTFDLIEAGYEPKPNPTVTRRVYTRGALPSLSITVSGAHSPLPWLNWPDDFVRSP